MKISVQSLFEDYEENAVSLNRDADAERILEKTRAKLPGLKKRRPVGLVLIAAAAVAVLCGAAAIVHYAAVRDGAGSYIMPDTLRYDEENKKTILVDTPFEWNNPISFDTEGRTDGKICGMRLGWLPEGWAAAEAPHTTFTFEAVDGETHTLALTAFDALHDAVTLDGCTLFYLIRDGMDFRVE